MAKNWAQKCYAFLSKNTYLKLIGLVLAGLIVSAAAIEAAKVVWDTRKVFVEAEADKDAISQLRKQVESQKESLDILLRDSNAAYREIASVKVIATEAKDGITSVHGLVKEAQASFTEAQVELERLKSRNLIGSLADNAISNGSVESYRRLESIWKDSSSQSEKQAAGAEIIRVFNAFAFDAPNTISETELNITFFNPLKKKIDDLTAEEICSYLELESDNPWNFAYHARVRAKLAAQIAERGRIGSYRTAYFLIKAMKKEPHLEALRYQRKAFDRITRRTEGDQLDGRKAIEWWEKNREEFRTKDEERDSF